MSRTLLVDGSVGTTGALVAATNIADALRDRCEMVLVVDDAAVVSPEVASAFLETESIRLCLPRRSLVAKIGYALCVLGSAVKLRLLCRRYGAEAVIFNDFYFAQGALLRVFGFRGRIVTWVRMDPRRYGRLGAFWTSLARAASDRIVAVSQHIRRIIETVPNVSVIFDPVPRRFGQKDDLVGAGRDLALPVFVFIANYIEGKGQDLALRALAKARERCPEIKLEFFGGDLGQERNRTYREALYGLANELGLSESVAFNDFAADPISVLQNTRGALVLSHSESFSMTALEASSASIPVIATRCGGPEEIIDDDVTGFLVEIDDISGTAAAMCRLADEPSLAKAMGSAGRERVSELFSVQEFGLQVRKVMNLQ